MNNKTIEKTIHCNLCVSCGICEAICPKLAISMKLSKGQYLPNINKTNCNFCGLCFKICPGIDILPIRYKERDIFNSNSSTSKLLSFNIYSKNILLRKSSTSGGVITEIITTLIKNNTYDEAFIVPPINCSNDEIKLIQTNNLKDIQLAAKSKYLPVSAYNIIKTLLKRDNKKYIIVATPCVLDGIIKVIRNFNIDINNLLFLGLFCDRTLNLNIIEYFNKNYNKSNDEIDEFDFRSKLKNGWPGNVRMHFKSGKDYFIDKSIRMNLKKYFTLNRCFYCFDKLNSFADISFGDCYIPHEESFYGKSNIIVRTNRGKDVMKEVKSAFVIHSCSFSQIESSQLLELTHERYNNAKYLYGALKNNVDEKKLKDYTTKNLKNNFSDIKLGKNKKYKKIERALLYMRIKGLPLRLLNKCTKYIYTNILYLLYLLNILTNKKKPINNNRSNVLIVGGELFNKGAQAMTFAVIDLIAQKYPEKKCILLSSMDYERDKTDKDQYKFKILPWNDNIRLRILSQKNTLIVKNYKYKDQEKHLKEIIKNASMVIDISGYQLSSQWGVGQSVNLLANIILAEKMKIPYYIFPQSMGPFNHYPIHFKIQMWLFLKIVLPKPKKIYVRENHGLSCLRLYTTKNTIKSLDFVLLTPKPSTNSIYNFKKSFITHKIKKHSVAIIPNARVIERITKEKTKEIYVQIINELLKKDKTIYIIRHAYDDLDVCENIKSWYCNNDKVILLRDDMNCFEIENIVKQFEFIVASRYHSIIHSYKNNVPAIVIGWAVKYQELLKEFDQLDNYFDCRGDINITKLLIQVSILINDFETNKVKIKNNLKILTNRYNFNNFE